MSKERNALTRKDWADARSAHERGEYEMEALLYRKLAEEGNPRAQAFLGVMYDKGRGVAQDFGEALKWFRTAAEAGEPRAVCNVGSMYDRGRGVVQDYAEALHWLEPAARTGNAENHRAENNRADQHFNQRDKTVAEGLQRNR